MKPRLIFNEVGQLMLMSILILVILGLSIPILVYTNQISTYQGLAVKKRIFGVGTVEQGLAYATHVLSTSSTTWQNALAGDCPAEFGIAPAPPTPYPNSDGTVFTIQCSTAPQSYEVRVIVRGGAHDPATGGIVYTKALRADLSQKSLAAVLPTEVEASAALVMMNVPSITPANGLLVHWGPIVSFDSTNQWNVRGLMNTDQYPRKFAANDITGPGPAGSTLLRSLGAHTPNTDNEEYWANSSLGFLNTIDKDSYILLAQNTTGVSVASCPSCSSTNTGDFDSVAPGSTATFAGGWSPPTTTASPYVIYVDGNAKFKDVAIDLKNSSGAFIVNGNLLLDNPSTQAITSNAIRVPPTAPLEYYYKPTLMPCPTAADTSNCTRAQAATNNIQFRGFLYVTGNLILNGNYNWGLDGAVRVDGQIQVPTGSLQILYDDQVNHTILVTPIELIIDSKTYIST